MTKIGASVTARTVVGEAWRRCCLQACVPHLATSADIGPVLAAAGDQSGSLVVLVDIGTATGDVVDALRRSGSTVLLLAATISIPVRSALRTGVQGLITMDDSLSTMRGALDLLMTDIPYVSPAGGRLLLDDYRTGPGDQPGLLEVVLTPRERAVLQAMVDGLTTKATARHLGIAVKTVEAHRRRLFTRLQVSSQSEAVTHALTHSRLIGTSPTRLSR